MIFRIPCKIAFLRIQLQNPSKSEMFKEAGWRDQLPPCHSLFLQELPCCLCTLMTPLGESGPATLSSGQRNRNGHIANSLRFAVTESASGKGIQCPLANTAGSSISHQLSHHPRPHPCFPFRPSVDLGSRKDLQSQSNSSWKKKREEGRGHTL